LFARDCCANKHSNIYNFQISILSLNSNWNLLNILQSRVQCYTYFIFVSFIHFLDKTIRLKAWEELPPCSKQPPAEVKNILGPVTLKANEDLKAWICYPSTSVFRANIMSPRSPYDFRMKLRAGLLFWTTFYHMLTLQ
jgi:hypothetical protein